MLSYGVREVKARLSSLLKEVQGGAEVLITDRGRPVGKLVAVVAEDLSLEARLARLERVGWLETEGARERQPLAPALPLSEPVAQRLLQEDRTR